MKKVYLIAIILLSSIAVQAQKSTTNEYKGLSVLFESKLGNLELSKQDNRQFRTIEFESQFKFTFNRRLSISVPFGNTLGLFKEQAKKDFETSYQFGLAAGYSPFNDGEMQFEIIGNVGRSFGGNWQFVYYDGGLRVGYLNGLYAGIGVRYYDTFKGDFGNHCNLYLTIGATIFSQKNRKNRSVE
jgi:hypothetical protein